MTPLLFLPGMMCDARQFGPQAAYFSRSRSVIVSPLTGFDTITDLAKEIITHAPQRFALCGLSMGGIVALEIMRIAPQRVERLALLDTTHRADATENAPIRDAQIVNVQNGKLEAVMREELKPRYLADGPAKKPTLDLCMTMAQDFGPKIFIDQSRALKSRFDQTETLQRIGVPTLVLCGEADTLCPVERHREMHQMIDGSTLEIVSDAGHLPPLEQPEATTSALAAWLRA